MEFAELLEIVGREPVFETGFLLAGKRVLEKQLGKRAEQAAGCSVATHAT